MKAHFWCDQSFCVSCLQYLWREIVCMCVLLGVMNECRPVLNAFWFICVGAQCFSSTLNAGSEANLYLWVEAWFGGKGNYFRVRRCAHKSSGNAQSCCLLHLEDAVEFSWGFEALGIFRATKQDLCTQREDIWVMHWFHELFQQNNGLFCNKTKKYIAAYSDNKVSHKICVPPLSLGHTGFISWWRSFNSFVLYGATPWPCGWRLMKSFSGDEGYQAPCSPRLIEQEFYIANYVVCIPLVSTVLSEGSAVGRPGRGIFTVVEYQGHSESQSE